MNRLAIIEMSISDYDEVISLWQSHQGIGLSDADSQENIQKFLYRNPGLSFVAKTQGKIIGAVLCGHDGRRAYFHHLVVAVTHRQQGIGKKLVEKCLSELQLLGIQKCHIHVYANNLEGQNFWKKIGWQDRVDLKVMSVEVSPKNNKRQL